MRYVLDSSVAVKWVIPEPNSDKADRLRKEFLQGLHEFHAPDIFPVGAAHALTRAERQLRIVVGQVRSHLTDILTTPPQFYRYRPLLLRAVDISSLTRVGVYDCLYVALAEQEQCELVTGDDKLVRTLRGRFPFIVPLAAMP
jgi:predicted nucleic acid-binding protein